MPEFTLNEVNLIGRLTRDPETRSLSSGDQVVNFHVATSEGWKDKNSDQWKERSQYHQVVVWNPWLIEKIVPHLKKGSRVMIKGAALEHRSYETNQNTTRYVTEVVLRYNGSINMLDRAPSQPVEESTASDEPFRP